MIDVNTPTSKPNSRQLPATVLPEGSAWENIAQLLLEFDIVQVRYVGTQFLKVVDYVSIGAEQTANYIPAIQLLHHVILRLDNSSSILTSTHRNYIRLCLLAQAYNEAVDILDRPISHIPIASDLRAPRLCAGTDQFWTYLNPATGLTHPITSRIFLEYHLLGALSYLAVRRYKDALLFLDIILAAPTAQNVASAIQVEAYKKWLLLGLILNGNASNAPQNITQAALKYIRAAAKPYDCIVDVFKLNDLEKLRAEIEAGNALWQEDGNYGLIVEVYQAFRKFAVLRLGKTFAALPVVDIAKRTSEDPAAVTETKSYLQSLIAEGELNAVVVQTESGEDILRFLPGNILQRSEEEVETALLNQTKALQTLLKQIHDAEHRFETTREYIDFLKKLKKSSDEKKKIAASGNARNASVDDLDEDMMEEY